jgi:hypothetical protein
MDEVEIDIEKVRLTIGLANNMFCPDLLCKCLAHYYPFFALPLHLTRWDVNITRWIERIAESAY